VPLLHWGTSGYNNMSPHQSAHAEVGMLLMQVRGEFSRSSPSHPEGAARAAAALRKAFEMLNFCCSCHGSLQEWPRPGRRYHHRCAEGAQQLDGRATGVDAGEQGRREVALRRAFLESSYLPFASLLLREVGPTWLPVWDRESPSLGLPTRPISNGSMGGDNAGDGNSSNISGNGRNSGGGGGSGGGGSNNKRGRRADAVDVNNGGNAGAAAAPAPAVGADAGAAAAPAPAVGADAAAGVAGAAVAAAAAPSATTDNSITITNTDTNANPNNTSAIMVGRGGGGSPRDVFDAFFHPPVVPPSLALLALCEGLGRQSPESSITMQLPASIATNGDIGGGGGSGGAGDGGSGGGGSGGEHGALP
ncbi:unnamed protein product, partial [Laminaria digitata]